MKKITLFVLIISLCFTLCGCFDYEEIKKLTMVSGIGIDYKNDEFVITAEIATMLQEGEQVRDSAKPKIIKSKGDTLYSALQSLNAENGGALFLKGCTLCIIGFDVAKKDIQKIGRFVLNNPDLPQTMEFIISEGYASDIFKATPETNQLLCKELTDSVTEDSQNTSTAIPCNVCDVFENENLFVSKVKKRGKEASLSGVYYIENDSIKSKANIKTAPYLMLWEGAGSKCVLPLSDLGDLYVTDCLKEKEKLKIEGSLFLKKKDNEIKSKEIEQILKRDFEKAIKNVLKRDEKINIELTIKAQNLNTEG